MTNLEEAERFLRKNISNSLRSLKENKSHIVNNWFQIRHSFQSIATSARALHVEDIETKISPILCEEAAKGLKLCQSKSSARKNTEEI